MDKMPAKSISRVYFVNISREDNGQHYKGKPEKMQLMAPNSKATIRPLV